MAYLTEYSYRQLIDRVEIENIDRIDNQFFKKHINDNEYLYYFFNQFELKKLIKEKVILSGDKTFLLAYKEMPARKDSANYVLEIKGNVKYHKNDQCKSLNSGFKNFFIPEPITMLEEDSGRHKELVKAIREWFDANNYTVQRYEDEEINDKILTTAFNETFPDKYVIEPILS